MSNKGFRKMKGSPNVSLAAPLGGWDRNQLILTKAIQKAIDGGYQWESPYPVQFIAKKFIETGDYPILIFEKNFAKALWPMEYGVSGTVDPRATSPSTARPLIDEWKMHLMEMVIAEDPIKYLGKNI